MHIYLFVFLLLAAGNEVAKCIVCICASQTLTHRLELLLNCGVGFKVVKLTSFVVHL